MHVVNHLVCHAAVVLQDVVLFSAGSDSDLLGDGEQLRQMLIWDVVKLGTVVLGNDKSMALRDGSDV